MKKLICIAIICCLAGCTTYYQKKEWWSGYEGYNEMKLGDNLYLVEYHSNAFTSTSMNFQHALHRAAELSKENGYRYFEISNSVDSSTTYTTPLTAKTTVDTNSSTYGTYNSYGNNSYNNGSLNTHSNGYGLSSTNISGGNTILKPGVSFIIKMLKNKTNKSMDADAILSNYKK